MSGVGRAINLITGDLQDLVDHPVMHEGTWFVPASFVQEIIEEFKDEIGC